MLSDKKINTTLILCKIVKIGKIKVWIWWNISGIFYSDRSFIRREFSFYRNNKIRWAERSLDIMHSTLSRQTQPKLYFQEDKSIP